MGCDPALFRTGYEGPEYMLQLNQMHHHTGQSPDVTGFPVTGQGIEPAAILEAGPVNQGPEIELLTSFFSG